MISTFVANNLCLEPPGARLEEKFFFFASPLLFPPFPLPCWCAYIVAFPVPNVIPGARFGIRMVFFSFLMPYYPPRADLFAGMLPSLVAGARVSILLLCHLMTLSSCRSPRAPISMGVSPLHLPQAGTTILELAPSSPSRYRHPCHSIQFRCFNLYGTRSTIHGTRLHCPWCPPCI